MTIPHRLIVPIFALAIWASFHSAHAGVIVQRPLSIGLTNGLVGYWSFDEQDMAGVTAYDKSGQGNNGTLTNGPTKQIGKIGQAMDFDGVADFVNAGSGASLDKPGTTSISAWIKPRSFGVGGKGRIINKGDDNVTNYGFFLNNTDITAGLDFFVGFGASLLDARSNNNVITLNTWQHVAVTWTGGFNRTDVRFYVNGSEVGTSGSSGGDGSGPRLDESACNFFIGTRGSTADCNASDALRLFNGSVDDVRIYNRALTPDEIKRLYNLGGTFKVNAPANSGSLTQGLVGHWTFDGKDIATNGSGVETALDRSGQGNNGTLTNGPAKTIGRIGQALKFDGADDYVQLGQPASLGVATRTISAWIYPRTLGQGNFGTVIHAGTNGEYYYIQMCTNNGECNSNVSTFVYKNNSGGDEWTAPANTIKLNQWQHVVITDTCNSADALLYYNGQQVATVKTASGGIGCGIVANTQNKHIGAAQDNPNSAFDGSIDDVRIYNRALSPDEIKRLYNLGGTFKVNAPANTGTLTQGLVGHWTFDGKDIAVNGSGVETALDKSGQSNNGTLTNGPTKTIGRIGQALSFDASDDQIQLGTMSSLGLATKTISAWIYPRSLGESNFGNVFHMGTAGDKMALTLCSNDGTECPGKTNTFVLLNRNGANSSFNEWAAPADTIKFNQWQQVAISYTCDAAEAVLYYNGQQVAATRTQMNGSGCASVTAENKHIGAAQDGSLSTFDGLIDDVRIYNRALSPDEVKRLYLMGK